MKTRAFGGFCFRHYEDFLFYQPYYSMLQTTNRYCRLHIQRKSRLVLIYRLDFRFIIGFLRISNHVLEILANHVFCFVMSTYHNSRPKGRRKGRFSLNSIFSEVKLKIHTLYKIASMFTSTDIMVYVTLL